MDIGSLRVSLALSSGEFVSGAEQAGRVANELGGNMERMGRQATAAGRSMGAARADVGNLAAQFQDIGVMLAAGQNPLTLAIQQGTQIGAVLGASGGGAAGAAKALGAALASVVSPVNLLTIGSIAAGAAMFQWLSGSAEEAESVEDALTRIRGSVDDYATALKAAGRPLSDLREEYHEWAEEVQEDLQRIAEGKERIASAATGELVNTLAGLGGTGEDWMDISTEAARELIEQQYGIMYDGIAGSARRARREIINELVGAYDAVSNSAEQSVSEQIAALDRLYEAARAAAQAQGGISTDEQARLDAILAQRTALIEVDTLLGEEGRTAEEAAERSTRAWGEYYQSRIAGEAVSAQKVESAAEAATRVWGEYYQSRIAGEAMVARAIQENADVSVNGYQQYQQSRVAGVNVSAAASKDALISAVAAGARAAGLDPAIVLAVMGVESAWNPGAVGGAGGNYQGLIQFGPNERQTYGVSASSSVEDQVAASIKFLLDRGVRADAEAANYYAAVLAGNANAVNAGDSNNGGRVDNISSFVQGPDFQAWLDQAERELDVRGLGDAVFGGVAEAAQAATEADRELQQARDKAAREAEAQAKRELGYREDLIEASQRATDDAQFELTLIGKSIEEQARLRAAYILRNQAEENGISLTERMANSTQTYGEFIDEQAAAVGKAAVQTHILSEAQERAAETARAAAAEMDAFAASLTSMALGPITSNPIGQFASTLPGFQTGAQSVFNGFLDSGFTGATSALTTALGGATSGLAGLGSALGAIAGPVGLAVGLFNGIKGSTETLDEGLRVMLDGLDRAVVQTYETTKTTRLWGLMSSTDTDYDPAEASLSNPINKAFSDLGAGILDLSRTLGKSRRDFADFSMSFQLSLEGMTDEQKVAAVEEQFGRVSDRLARMAGVTSRYIEEGETATQALERLVVTFGLVNDALDLLDFQQLKTGEASTKLAAKMAEAAGGIDALASSTQTYFDNFLTEQEQAAELQEQFNEGLKDVGIKVPITTMEDFVAEVERLEAAGKDVKAAGLIGLSEEFLALAEALEETGEAVRSAEDIASERRDLERQIWELTGNTAAIRRDELEQLDPSNRALQERIYALEDEQAALEAQQAILDEQNGLLGQWYTLTEQNAKLHDLQLEGISEENQALQERIWLGEEIKQVQDERYALETQLLELQGDTAALRARELEELSPYNRALQEQIWMLEDAKAAVDALNGSDFATLFDFEKTQGLAANMATAPTLEPAQETSKEMKALRDEVAAMRAENRQLLLQVEQAAYTTASVLRKWDKIGQPDTRAA